MVVAPWLMVFLSRILGCGLTVNPDTKSKAEKGLFKCVKIANRSGHGIEKNQKI
jgi:hypothetical protein